MGVVVVVVEVDCTTTNNRMSGCGNTDHPVCPVSKANGNNSPASCCDKRFHHRSMQLGAPQTQRGRSQLLPEVEGSSATNLPPQRVAAAARWRSFRGAATHLCFWPQGKEAGERGEGELEGSEAPPQRPLLAPARCCRSHPDSRPSRAPPPFSTLTS